MRYDEYRRQGLPLMSSHVESTIEQINYRVKVTEKFWSEAGAEALLELRADYMSDGGCVRGFLAASASVRYGSTPLPPLGLITSHVVRPPISFSSVPAAAADASTSAWMRAEAINNFARWSRVSYKGERNYIRIPVASTRWYRSCHLTLKGVKVA
jgi:hypothetical protein